MSPPRTIEEEMLCCEHQRATGKSPLQSLSLVSVGAHYYAPEPPFASAGAVGHAERESLQQSKEETDAAAAWRAAAGWLALSELQRMTTAATARLLRRFGSFQALSSAPASELGQVGLCPEEIARLEESSERIFRHLRAFSHQGLQAVPFESSHYPRALLDLRNPPAVLFVSGELRPADAHAIAIVGTRTPSAEGRRIARELARRAAAAGFCVVSGLARGIDTEAHSAALRAGGRSIAVLGSGLLNIYPPENRLLASRIRRQGALMSEVWPEAPVSRQRLLARDRLQAAFSQAVVVVQSHLGCGSLTTARYAVSCRRPLFAICWQEEPFAAGLARLRQIGAAPIRENDLEKVFRAADLGSLQGSFPSLPTG